jgi:Domain of unknown function (DUF4845)
MEPNRQGHRVTGGSRHGQAGITALGFLILATLVGVVGLGVIKIVPIYIKNMRMNTILEQIQSELSGQGATPSTIRVALAKRFAVEDINMDIDALKITQSKDGYTLRVNFESREPYIADIYLLVVYDRQVEIRR